MTTSHPALLSQTVGVVLILPGAAMIVVAGGHGSTGAKAGDSLIADALPRR